MSNYTTQTSDKSKKTAIICCLIGGVIGAHDFYLGRIVAGLIKLFTLNFVGFGWFIDMIKLLTGSYRDNVGVPLRK